MSFRAAALTVALAAAMLAAVPPAQAAEPGVVPDLNWGTSTADQDRTAAAIRDVGARWVRLHVQWKYWEPNGPLADVVDNGSRRSTDRAVQLARGAGAKVIVMVYNAPAWAAARTSSEGSTPRDPAEYAAFVRRLAAHYRGQVEAYEVWNEPDLQRFWAGGPNPTAYTALLRAAYPAIKAGDPSAKVVFGGLSWDYAGFLGRAYAAGAKGFFDVMAVHPYQSAAPNATWRTWYGQARQTMLQNGEDKPVWFTEWGYNTSTKVRNSTGDWQTGVSETTQAAYLTAGLTMLEQDPWVEVVLWYNFRNNYWQNDADEVEARFGLLRSDFSRKPAYDAFKAYASAAAPVPPSPTVPPPPPSLGIPEVTITAPRIASTFSRSLRVIASATDDVRVTRLEAWIDGKLVKTTTSSSLDFWWGGAKKASPGPHTVLVVAYDAAGLAGRASVVVTK